MPEMNLHSNKRSGSRELRFHFSNVLQTLSIVRSRVVAPEDAESERWPRRVGRKRGSVKPFECPCSNNKSEWKLDSVAIARGNSSAGRNIPAPSVSAAA